jgi:uncharacterized protein (TIGR03437 family)
MPRRHLFAFLLAAGSAYGQLFQPGSTVPLGQNTVYAVADFNLDGRLDLARGAALTGQLTVAFGVSDGAFTAPNPPMLIETPLALVPGDFDHDGKTDLAVLTGGLFSDPGVRVLLSSGTGTFTPRPATVLQILPRAAAAGDFDQDGNLDLAFVATNPAGVATISLLRGNGRGDLSVSFLSAPVTVPVPNGPSFGEMQAVDLNGDRRLDLVMTVSHVSGVGLATAIGDGRGSFTATAVIGNQPPLLRPTPRMAVADFNSDRGPDVVMFGYLRDQVTLWLNSGGVLVPQVSSSSPLGTNPFAIVAADFDLDGRMDFAVSRDADLNVAFGAGVGSFVTNASSTNAFGGPAPYLEAGDFNGDRRQDLLIGEGSAAVFRVLNNVVPRPPTLLTQTIQFTQPADRGLNDGPLTPTVSASSGLPVTLAGITNPVCTVSKGVVSMVALGTCTILAIQPGDATYSPAPIVQRSFTVARNTQTITFAALLDRTLDASPFTVSATASSGLTVAFTASPSNVCTVSGTTVTLAGLGQCSITASQAGNATFPAAVPVVRTFTVSAVVITGPRVEAVANAASYVVGTLAPASYAVIFGQRLENAVVRLRDAAGASLTPEIIFAGATQINFIVPGSAARGAATITVTTPNGAAEFAVTIAATAPGLFSANGSGQGLAAAQALIVNNDKSITTLTVADGPIPVRGGTEIYLVLYGTGIRGRTPNAVFASVAGSQVEVLYAGPQGTFPALDQVNVRVPLTVAGVGTAEIRLIVDGVAANVVTARFQ